MRNFRHWDVWLSSKKLVTIIYSVTNKFPDSEKFGIVSQMRRAAISIPLNIAEGAGRSTEKDFRSFSHIAMGSAFELETLLDISKDLGFLDAQNFTALSTDLSSIQKQLNAFIKKL